MALPRSGTACRVAFLLLFAAPVAWAQSNSQPDGTPLALPAHRTAAKPVHASAAPPRKPTHMPPKKPTAPHASARLASKRAATKPKPLTPPTATATKARAPSGGSPAKSAEPRALVPADVSKGSVTGLPLPRFAALRADDVNLRAGPGTRYPIDWLYKRRGLPVEIDREFEVWRLVTAPDGTKGWVHEATLTGRRDFLVLGADRTLRAEPRDAARAVAILKPGVVGRIRACAAGSQWCRLEVGNRIGWLKRDEFWGTKPGEAVAAG